jgi:hypothetical protein
MRAIFKIDMTELYAARPVGRRGPDSEEDVLPKIGYKVEFADF